jgi:hypothetical protein
MSEWNWTGWWNKDTKAAGKVILAILLLAALGFFLFGCASHTPTMSFGMGYETGENVVGDSPVGHVSIKQPIVVDKNLCTPHSWIYADYTHMSSIPQANDDASVDTVSIMFSVPLRNKND